MFKMSTAVPSSAQFRKQQTMGLPWAHLGSLRPHVSSSLDSRQPSYRQFTEMVYWPGYSSFSKQILQSLHSLLIFDALEAA